MASRSTADVAVRYRRGTALAAILVATLWHLLNDVPSMLASWNQYRSAAAAYTSAAVWLVYGLIGTAAGVQQLRAKPTVKLEWLALPALIAGLAVVTYAAAPDGWIGPANWAWGTFGWYALLVWWRRPLRYVLIKLLASGVTVLITVGATQPIHHIDVARWAGVVVGTTLLQLTFIAGARMLERDATRAAEASARRDDIVANRLAAAEVHRQRVQRLEMHGRSARVLLAALADGAVDPCDAAVQRAAAIEAARLRRLLAEHDDVPDPLLHELRASIDIAERRGVAVDLTLVGTVPKLPRHIRRALIDAPLCAIASSCTKAKVTVAGRPDELNVAVIADIPADAEPALALSTSPVQVYLEREDETLCLTATWHR